jgi:hypothetical protein
MALRAALRGGALAVARPHGLRAAERRAAHGGLPSPPQPAAYPQLLGALACVCGAVAQPAAVTRRRAQARSSFF